MLIKSRIRSIIERCHFQWPWMTPNLVFKVTVLFQRQALIKAVHFYCATVDNYLTSGTLCRWRAVPWR